MRALSQREQQLVAVAILIAVLALLQFLIIGPLIDGFSLRAQQRAELALEYQHNERLIASVPRLTKAAETSRENRQLVAMTAIDVDHAGIALEERLKAAVEATGGQFKASDHNISQSKVVTARVDAQATLSQLVQILNSLQNKSPYVVIESLNVAADEALISQKLAPMDVKIEVSIIFSSAAA